VKLRIASLSLLVFGLLLVVVSFAA